MRAAGLVAFLTLLAAQASAVELPRAKEQAQVVLPDFGAELRAFARQRVSWWPHVVNAAWGGGRGGPERKGGWLDEHWTLVDYLDRSADYSTHEWLAHRGIWAEVYGSNEYQETIHFHEEGARKLLWDNGIARDMAGERVLSQHYNTSVPWWKEKIGWDAFIVCNNAPRWWAVIHYDWLTSPLLGDAISQDNIGGPTSRIGAGGHGRYCDFCNRKFRHYLQTTDRLPDFRRDYRHIRDYVEKNLADVVRQLPPHTKPRWNRAEGDLLAKLCAPPVMSEYQKCLYLTHLHGFLRHRRDAKLVAERLGKEFDVHGNQGGGFIGPNPYQVALSDFVDTVWFESSGLSTYDVFKHNWNNAWGALRYTMGWAMTQGERPFMSMTGFHKHTPDLVEHEMAEACAGGGVLFVNQQHFEKEPEVEKLLAGYFRFRHARRALFATAGKRRHAQVALAYSVPTMMYDAYQYVGDAPPINSLSGMARALLEAHIPFDVVILRHPEIRADAVTLDELRRYKVVILPALECLSDHQVDLLTRYAQGGRTLGLLGQSGIRDENNLPRKQPPQAGWPEVGRTAELLPGRSFGPCRATASDETRALGDAAAAAVRKALGGQTIVSGKLPRMLWVHAWLHGEDLLSLHFVNYAIDFETGKATPTEPTRVTIALPPTVALGEALWLTPDGRREPVELMVDGDGAAHLTLPSVRVYGILVIGGAGVEERRSATLQAAALAARAVMAGGRDDPAVQGLAAMLAGLTGPRRDVDPPLGLDQAPVLVQAAEQVLRNIQAEQDAAYLARVRAMAAAEGAVLAIDFGGEKTEGGWRKCGVSDRYDPERRFGWLETPDDTEPTPEERWYAMAAKHGGKVATEIVAGRLLFWPYREAPPVPLRTHLACGGPRRFRIDLEPGDYVVRVAATMPSWTNRNFLVSGMVACNGAVRLLDAPMDKGSLVARDFAVTVQDDRKLELTFGAATGWGIAAIVVYKAGGATEADPLELGGLRAWRVSPRYPNPDWWPIDQAICPPEFRLDRLPAPDWTEAKAPPTGMPVVDLGTSRQADVGDIVYAATVIDSPEARTASLHFAATSAAQLWLNGEALARVPNEKGLRRDELVVPLSLRAGRNTLLVKLQRFWERRWLFAGSLDPPRD